MARLTIVPPVDPSQPECDDLPIASPDDYTLTDAMRYGNAALKMAHNAGDPRTMILAATYLANLKKFLGPGAREQSDDDSDAVKTIRVYNIPSNGRD